MSAITSYMATKTIAGMKVIPSGFRVKTTAGGTDVLVKKTRSRRRYKLPKATRDRMRASRNKIKIPVVQGAILLYPVAQIHSAAMQAGVFGSGNYFKQFGLHALWRYTGFNENTKKIELGRATGLLSLLGWTALRKSGIFKGANAFLGRNKVPLLRL